MTKEVYAQLEKKFDCGAGKHKFDTRKITNLSQLKDLDSPLMWTMLMQLGDATCDECGIKQIVYRKGILFPGGTKDVLIPGSKTNTARPGGNWNIAKQEDVDQFQKLKDFSC